MAYIGSTPTSQNFTSGTDYFSGTGSQTAFTLTRTVNSVNDIEVVINNVVQQPSTAYTLSGTTVTFTSAPSSGTNNIYVRYLATNMQSFTVSANSIDKSKLSSDLQAGFQGRNRIINGHMVVDQRNAGASVTPTANTYTLDRWQALLAVASKYSVQQSSTAPIGFSNSLLITSTSAYTVGASEFFFIRQRIEGLNISDLGWGTANAKPITLSFWTRSSLTGAFGGSIRNSDASRTYPFSYTISNANTWEQKTITVAGDTTGSWLTTNGVGIELDFTLGAGTDFRGTANTWSGSNYLTPTGATSVVGTSGATFYITGVQLEEGNTATSFEREIYSTTLQKCQRYYFSTFASAGAVPTYNSCGSVVTSNQTEAIGARTPCTMRATPTFTIWNSSTGASGTARFSGSNIGVSSVNGSTVEGFQGISLSSSASTAGVGSYAFTASAEL